MSRIAGCFPLHRASGASTIVVAFAGTSKMSSKVERTMFVSRHASAALRRHGFQQRMYPGALFNAPSGTPIPASAGPRDA